MPCSAIHRVSHGSRPSSSTEVEHLVELPAIVGRVIVVDLKIRAAAICVLGVVLLISSSINAIPVKCLIPDFSVVSDVHFHPNQRRALLELDLLLEFCRFCHANKIRNGVGVIDEHAVFTNIGEKIGEIVFTCVRDVNFCVRVHHSFGVLAHFSWVPDRVLPDTALELPFGSGELLIRLPKFSQQFHVVIVDVGDIVGVFQEHVNLCHHVCFWQTPSHICIVEASKHLHIDVLKSLRFAQTPALVSY